MYKLPFRDRCSADTRTVLQLLFFPSDTILATLSVLYKTYEANFKAHVPMKCYENVVFNVSRLWLSSLEAETETVSLQRAHYSNRVGEDPTPRNLLHQGSQMYGSCCDNGPAGQAFHIPQG